MQSIEISNFKNAPPKTVIEYVTKEIVVKQSIPCPSEEITVILATPFGPLPIHVRPGDLDRTIEQKHEAIKEIEKERMKNKGNDEIREKKKRTLNRRDI